MKIIHPLADEWTDEYAVYVAQTSHVLLSDPLDSFLQWSVSEGLRPVLVTGPDVRISPLATLALNRSGAFWAVRTADCVFDGLSGYRIGGFTELWSGELHAGERQPGFTAAQAHPQAVLGYDVFGHQRAAEQTRVGELAGTVQSALGGPGFDLWGLTEPLLEPFDVQRVTETARRGMPDSDVLHARAGDGSYAAITASRTRRGILEHVTGGTPIGDYPNQLAPLVEAATRALMAVQAAHQPTIGFVSLAEVAPGVVQTVGIRRPEVPLAVLLGPRAVHDLAAEIDGLRQRHDVLVLGRPRLPSLLVRFSRTDQGSWSQLIAFAHDLGVERVQQVAGLAWRP
ncbi:DUF6177 family protein [Micropruina sp.]|uniref:DUF6177 family protein n=1 Tax=Micropruina sp. TaxID=2737536 RepID=UPI002617A133|nr:DUF6177 family protein [Micropruina sp.]